MKLSVISCAYGAGGYDKAFRLRDSCERAGLPLHLYGLDLPWPECKQAKLIDLEEQLRQLMDKGYSHALWSDAFDSFVCPGVSQSTIVELCREFYGQSWYRPVMIFSAEKNCYPFSSLRYAYPNPGPVERFPWRYICAGGWLADIHHLLTHLPSVIDQTDPGSGDDQRAWTKAFLNGYLPGARLDYNCKIFQTMHQTDEPFASHGYVVNPVTRSLPCFVHFNGSSCGADGRLDQMYREVF